MSCNIHQIKIDGINKVKRIFKGNANSVSFDDKMSTKVNISYGKEFKVKTKAQAYNMVKSKINKINKWSKETFKTDAFKDQWATIYQYNDNISVEFKFPKSLLNAYERKLNVLPKQADFSDLIDDSAEPLFEYKESKKNTPETIDSNEVLFKDGKNSVQDVLNNLKDYFTEMDKDTSEVLDRIQTFSKLVDTKIQFVKESALEDELTVMQYDGVNNVIQISKDRVSKFKPEFAAESFLHELTHSITARVIENPSSMDAKMAVQTLTDAFKTYFRKGSNSYGFTNIHEFVAETRNNAKFQEELKDLSLWDKIVEAIRRLFGMTTKYNTVFDAILTLEKESQSHELFEINSIFASKKEVENFDTTTLEGRIDELYDNIEKTNDVQLKRLTNSKKSASKSYATKLKIVKDTLEKYRDVNKLEGIVSYLKNTEDAMIKFNKSIARKDFDVDTMKFTLANMKRYFDLYSIIEQIDSAEHDIQHMEGIKEEDIDNISDMLNVIRTNYVQINKKLSQMNKEYFAHRFKDITYHTKVEAKWREKFNTEYRELYKRDKSKLQDKDFRTEWVRQKLIDNITNIENDIEQAIRYELHGKIKDITPTAYWLTTALEIDSAPITIAQKIFTKMRSDALEEIDPIDKELSELHKKFTQGKTTGSPKKLYKNLYEKDSKGRWYFKGKYKAEFKVKYEKLRTLETEMNAAENKWETTQDSEDLATRDKLKKEYDILEKTLFQSDPTNLFNKIIKSEWKNDLSKLTSIEKEVLDKFHSLIEKSDKDTHGWGSLKSKIKTATFYKLPTQTKSRKERILDGTLKGEFKEAKDALFEERPDDIEYATEKASVMGDIMQDIPIHFRGILSNSEDQSLDLFTLMHNEIKNSVTFKHKNKNRMELELLLDIAKDTEFIQTKGFTKTVNSLTGKYLTLKDSKKNTQVVKKLKGMMQTQLYDITKEFAGKVRGADVNKIIGGINGYTGFLGMTFNYASATANMLSGNAQTLINAMAKDQISTKDISKAMKIYLAHSGDNIKDLGEVFDGSYPSQILKLFDVMGGYNIGIESFLNDKKWKNLIDSSTLTFMHAMGEHQIQSVVTMAVLNSVKPMDKNGKIIKGKTMLDMISINKKTGLIEVDKQVVFTSHSPLTEWKDGGKIEMQHLIKHKITTTQGAYDKNVATEAEKNALGSLMMMYKKFFAPLARERFRGFGTAFTKREDISEDRKYFNDATKEYREGFYSTFVRFGIYTVIPSLTKLKFKMMTSEWNDLTDHQRSNIKKVTVEMAGAFILSLLGSLAAKAADDDDDQLLYFFAYMSRRVQSELLQFSNPKESFRMTTSPFAAQRTVENLLGVIQHTIGFIDGNIDVHYKGVKKNAGKLLPANILINHDFKKKYNYLNSVLTK